MEKISDRETDQKKEKKKIHTHTHIFGQRNLAGYSPRGCKESTRISAHAHTHIYIYACVYTYIYICVCVCVLSHFSHV